MILTASKPVNVRLGKPSVNAPNPRFLIPGERVLVKSRVIGDSINGNRVWVVTDANEFIATEGFAFIDEVKSVPFFAHLENVPKLFNELNISKLWNVSRGEGINLGIIDSGVARHPSLRGKVTELNGKMSEDLNGHGTTMACIINSLNEAEGKIGVAPMVENIFSYAIDITKVEPAVLTDALDQMLKLKVNVINLSFSLNSPSFFKPRPGALKLQDKINELVTSGCIIVAATGNDHRRDQEFYPAKYDNIISVAGFNDQGNLDIDSNMWSGVSISMSSEHYFNDDQFEHSNGTSGAAAMISGCISCVYNSLPDQNKTVALRSILSTLQPISVPFSNTTISIPKFDMKNFLKSIKP